LVFQQKYSNVMHNIVLISQSECFCIILQTVFNINYIHSNVIDRVDLKRICSLYEHESQS